MGLDLVRAYDAGKKARRVPGFFTFYNQYSGLVLMICHSNLLDWRGICASGLDKIFRERLARFF